MKKYGMNYQTIRYYQKSGIALKRYNDWPNYSQRLGRYRMPYEIQTSLYWVSGVNTQKEAIAQACNREIAYRAIQLAVAVDSDFLRAILSARY